MSSGYGEASIGKFLSASGLALAITVTRCEIRIIAWSVAMVIRARRNDGPQSIAVLRKTLRYDLGHGQNAVMASTN